MIIVAAIYLRGTSVNSTHPLNHKCSRTRTQEHKYRVALEAMRLKLLKAKLSWNNDSNTVADIHIVAESMRSHEWYGG
jgi:hypothetical protein